MTSSPDAVNLEIRTLCKEGDELASRGDFAGAKRKYRRALALLPEDHQQLEGAAWVYAAAGETELALGERDSALECFTQAVQCLGGWGNPHLHLRLGQLHLERGDEEGAAVELIRAYRTGGIAVFMDGDPKYLEFLRARTII
jgi:tetratricopeptide (TPR) repeat protein